MGKVKFVFFNILIYGLCAFMMLLGVMDYIDDQGKLAAIRGGIIVQAEWIGIIPDEHRGHGSTYDLGYEYIDENGVRYREECTWGFGSIEEAKSHIGEKVDIYIDGKGHSIAVYKAEDFDKNTAWVLMGVAIGVIVCYTTGLIIWGVIKHRHKRNGKSEDTPSVI
ncbi:MAG: hypothetical protein K2M95_00740 [Clostridiales bacterium]|nr:hypothetical protein [Clostridiales bacterium]